MGVSADLGHGMLVLRDRTDRHDRKVENIIQNID